MKWIGVAFTGWFVGWLTFILVWAFLRAYFIKDDNPATGKLPPWPTVWAVSIAFIVIALSWEGFFREVIPLPAPNEYEKERY